MWKTYTYILVYFSKYSLLNRDQRLTLDTMSTLAINVAPPASASDSHCAKCSGPTRLTGIEPHPVKLHIDLRTYQCRVCEHVQASEVHVAS